MAIWQTRLKKTHKKSLLHTCIHILTETKGQEY